MGFSFLISVLAIFVTAYSVGVLALPSPEV
jgi:hypothetical protein